MAGRWRVLAIGVVIGLIAATGQAPLGFTLVGFLAIALFVRVAQHAGNWRRAAWIGWSVGLGYFCGTLFWIVEPFMVDVATHGWMAPFALFFMAGGMALFWGLAAGVAARFGGAVALALCLAAVEMARSYVLTGFPWALIGYIWLDTPVIQLAAWIGPHGVTLLTTLAAAGLAVLSQRTGRVWLAGAVGAVAAVTYAPWQPAPAEANGPMVRLIQPNAPQHQKWDPAFHPVFLKRLLEMTAAPATVQPDLIVWPETTLPRLLNNADGLVQTIAETAGDRPVIFGAIRREGIKARNSMVVLSSTGVTTHVYDKHHLVPFGEYLPLAWILNSLGLYGLAEQAGGYQAGPGPEILDLGETLGTVLPLICYEAIFPHDVAGTDTRPGWILQITNDAWFGNLAGPQQHLAQARIRAIEQGLPLLRAANTGVTAVIGPRGEIHQSIALNTTGFLDARVPMAQPATLYSRSGDWPILVLLIAGFTVRRIGRSSKQVDA
jgi:apolipoprotein N-acyltransferase